MHVFISWSGDFSRQVAVAIQEWLPAVLQAVKPFVSDKDIHSGTRWQAEVTGKLDSSQFGILCVTTENQNSPWLQFEAGALSKSIEDSRVVPLLIDLKKSDLLLPLNMFQAEILDRGGIARLLQSLNASLTDPLDGATLESLVEMWWPKLEERLNPIRDSALTPPSTPKKKLRTERDMLEELITSVRAIQKDVSESAPSGVTSTTTRARARRFLNDVKEAVPGVSLSGTLGATTVRSPRDLSEPEREELTQIAERHGATIRKFESKTVVFGGDLSDEDLL